MRTWWMRDAVTAMAVSHPCDSPAIDEEVRAALGLCCAMSVGIADPMDRFSVYKDVRTAGNRRSAAGVGITDPDNGWHGFTPYGFTRK